MPIIVVTSLAFFVILLLWLRLLPLEIVVLGVPVVLSLTGILPLEKAFSGFSQPAVIAIISLFILSEGLSRTKVVRNVSRLLETLRKRRPALLVPAILATVGLFAMFLNDTGTTALFLPVVLSLLHEARLSEKPLLLPLGYAAILGGSATLIGTSSNIVISGFLETQGHHPFRMFDFFPIGAGAFLLGVGYLGMSRRKLFRSSEKSDVPSLAEEERTFDLELVLGKDFPDHGKPFLQTLLHTEVGLSLRTAHAYRILSARARAQSFLKASWDWTRMAGQAGDLRRPVPLPELSPEKSPLSPGLHLHVVATLPQLHKLSDIRGIFLLPVQSSLQDPEEDLKRPPLDRLMESEEWILAQAMLAPRSGMIGRKISSLHFLLPPEVDIVGIHRDEGRRISGDLSDLTIEPGDLLLIQGTRQAVENLSSRKLFLYLDLFERETFRSDKALLALTILGAVVLSNVFGWLPLALSAVMGAILMLLTGCLTLEEAKNAIEWRVVMLLGGLFPLGWAISQTGLGHMIAHLLSSQGHTLPPIFLLALLMGTTALMVQFLSHNLVALIMAPIAMDLSRAMDLSPYPLMMGVAFAATMSFLTPFSHPVNTMTWGPGDYRFSDYLRSGAVLLILAFLWGLFEIPRRFPFAVH